MKKIWSLDTPCYQELVADDLDGDGKKEIVALGNSFVSENRLIYGKYVQRKYFLDIYKENLLLSTFQDSKQNNVLEDEDEYEMRARGLFVADLDRDRMKEIIVSTPHQIGFYKYLLNRGEAVSPGRLVMITAFQPSLPGEMLRVNAVSLIQEQGEYKLIVWVNVEIIEKHVFLGQADYIKKVENRGYVLVYGFSKEKKRWLLSARIPLEIGMMGTLLTADLDDANPAEICILGQKSATEAKDAVFYVMKKKSEWSVWTYPAGIQSFVSMRLGAGRLQSIKDENEIVAVKPGIMQLDIYEWTEQNGLVSLLSKNLADDKAFSSVLKIIVADIDHDGSNEIILAGFGRSTPENGDLFLGVYNQKLEPIGRIIGGGLGEKRVQAVAIID